MVPQNPDLVIIGAGLTGAAAALLAREQGRSVVLVEKRSFPGWEVAAHNHSFVGAGKGDDDLRRIPPGLRSLFQFRTARGELLLSEGFTRTTLLEILETHGIPVLFEAEAVAIQPVGDGRLALTLASPPGLLNLISDSVVDATDRHAVCRMAAGRRYLEQEDVDLCASFEMTRSTAWDWIATAPDAAAMETLPEIPGFLRDHLTMHPTLRADTVNVAYGLTTRADGVPYLCRSRLETVSRGATMALAAHLRSHHPLFKGAHLSHLGFECRVLSRTNPTTTPRWPNLIAAPLLPWGFTLTDMAETVDTLRGMLAKAPPAPPRREPETGTLPFEDDGLPVRLYRDASPPMPGEVFRTDICVAGVGAGGGLAMVAAIESGLQVVALEVNRDFGGTHTLGRVAGYYHGHREGMNRTLEQEAESLLAPVTDHFGSGGLGHAAVLLEKARQAGARVFTGTRVVGVHRDGNRVARVLAANEDGVFAVEAGVTIDTTGDADVAAHAAVPFEVGDPRDGMVQTFSMWGVEPMPTASWLSQRFYTDPDIIHPHIYSERIRAIHHGHRHNSPFHISPMVTVRESRRIAGDHALSIEDILSSRTPEDVIAVGLTPADSHAYTSHDLALMGHIGSEVPLRARIPYGCFVPKGIEGLLVGSKALSGERDATSFCRMNADIKHAGYALGRAAAMAVAGKVGLRSIPLPSLQEELRQKGILPDWARTVDLGLTAEERVEALLRDGLGSMEPVFLAAPHEARRALLRSWQAPGLGADARRLLAQCLAWHGEATGADSVAEQILEAMANGRHETPPVLRAPRGHIVTRLGGGDDHSSVTRLVVVAGRSGSPKVVPVLASLIRKSPGPGQRLRFPMPYDENRRDIVGRPFYGRLMALATAVESLACPELAAPMEDLLRRDGVVGHAVPLGSWKVPDYMSAHLEVRLARAAIRCGSRLGREILSAYRGDTHHFFRRHAMLEAGDLPS